MCTITVHKYGVSIQISIMVREMFRQITQKLWTTWTRDLDKLFIYQSFIITGLLIGRGRKSQISRDF